MMAPKRISHRILIASIAISLLCVTAFDLQAQSQSGMSQTACSQYKQVDEALNAAYTKILKDYAKDAQFVAKLKQAQRAWIAFRDAHVEARFPKADKQAEYGSAYPACRCTLLTELTEPRTKELKVWVDGIPEGDVCNGSVKNARTSENESSNPTRRSAHSCKNIQDSNLASSFSFVGRL